MTTTVSRPETGRALWRATLIGTVFQVAMVVGGHYVPALKSLFGPAGMLISLGAGWMFGRMAPAGSKATAALGGLAAGAGCAFLGILESFYLGDVPASLLALGTASSAVTGALGGLLSRLARR